VIFSRALTPALSRCYAGEGEVDGKGFEFPLPLGECLKTLRSPFDKLRANGAGIEIIDNFPFMLSLSKHETLFLSTPPWGEGQSEEKGETMPYNDPDPTDPSMLVGVILPAEAETMTDMAYVFAEEFARLGYDRKRILWLFKNPFYGGAHGAYRALGEKTVRAIIDECLAVWGGIQFSISDCGLPNGEREKIQNPKSEIPNSEKER